MNCHQARTAMLDADLEELRGEGTTQLAAHLRACAACPEAAARIIARTSMMRETMAAAVLAADPQIPPSPPLRAAAPLLSSQAARRRGRSASWRRALGTAIAMAAGIAVILVLGRDSSSRRIDLYVPPAHVPASPIVNASGSSGVAVIETPDPRITVIWTY